MPVENPLHLEDFEARDRVPHPSRFLRRVGPMQLKYELDVAEDELAAKIERDPSRPLHRVSKACRAWESNPHEENPHGILSPERLPFRQPGTLAVTRAY